MAGTFSDATEKALLDTLTRNGSAYQPAGLYLALFTVNPDFELATGGTEATGGNYGRQAISFAAATLGVGTTQSTSNIVWTVGGGAGVGISAGTYTGWAVYSAITDGTMLFGTAFSSSKTLVASGDTLTFSAGSVTMALS